MNEPQPLPADKVSNPIEVSNPFKFLDFYGEGDEDKYSGRQRDLRELLAKVTIQRTSVLYARSGLGKTSLLLAGVFPEVRRRGYLPIYVRTLTSPIGDLKASVLRACGGDADTDDWMERLRRASKEQPVLLAFDQFEEFFIRFEAGSDERADFIAALGALVADRKMNLRVLISLREDFLASLGDFRQELDQPGLFSVEYRLQPLTAFGARQAITRPLSAAGIGYDPRLIGRLVDLLATEGFDPVLLQIICTEVFEQAQSADRGPIRLHPEDLDSLERDVEEEDAAGSETSPEDRKILGEVLRRYLNRAIRGLPEALHLVARAVLDALITLEKTKKAVTREHFAESDLVATEDELEAVLEFLENNRLVRAEPRHGQTWYELRHDRLVDTVLEWIEGDREFFNYREARNLLLNLRRQQHRWRDNPELLLARGAIEDVVGKPELRDRLVLDRVQAELMVRSGLFRIEAGLGEDHLRHWCDRLRESWGDDALVELVREALDSKHPKMREGAATAVRRLGLRDSELGDRLISLALDDSATEARRAAGSALARVAGDQELAALDAALRGPGKDRRRRARETLADLQGGEFSQGGELSLRRFRWFHRWRARRIHAERQREIHRQAISGRGRTGALAGLLGSLLWSATLGFGFSAVFLWQVGPQSWSLGWGQGWLFVAIQLVGFTLLLSPLGGLMGWALGRRTAEIAAVAERESWSQATRRTVTIYAVLLVPTLWLLALYFSETSWGYASTFHLLWLTPALFVVLCLNLMIWVIQRCAQAEPFRWLWLGAASWALPMGLVMMCHFGLRWVVDSRLLVGGEELETASEVLTAAFGILLSWFAFVLGVSASRATRVWPVAPRAVSRRGRTFARTLVAILAVLIPTEFFGRHGFDIVPVPPIRPSIAFSDLASEAGEAHYRVDLARGFDTSYFRVEVEPGVPRRLVLSSPDGRIWINGLRTRSDLVTEVVDVAVDGSEDSSQTLEITMKLEELQVLDLEGDGGKVQLQVKENTPQIVWRWQAPRTGVVFFDTVGTDFDTVLVASSGRRQLDQNDDSDLGGGASRVEFRATQGKTYYLVLTRYSGSAIGSARVVLRWSYDQPPLEQIPPAEPMVSENQPPETPAIPPSSNDTVGEAVELQGAKGSVEANSSQASAQRGEPPFLGQETLWWTWEAPGDGAVYFETTGSSFDTLLGIYRRDGSEWQALAENDDAEGNTSRTEEILTLAGEIYYIGVGGYSGATGDVRLGWRWTSIEPAAGTFSNATPLERRGLGRNRGATAENGEPPHAGRPPRRTIWWSWVSENTGRVCLEARARGFTPILAVYVGTAFGDLRTLASQDPRTGSEAWTCWPVEEGTAYRIVVGSRDDRAGLAEVKLVFY